MRSMFQVGFEREVFSERHPNMGLSINDIQGWWKANYPAIKQDLKPLATQPVPGTVPLAPSATAPKVAPAPSSAGSTALWVGGLAALALGGYYLLSPRPFGIKK